MEIKSKTVQPSAGQRSSRPSTSRKPARRRGGAVIEMLIVFPIITSLTFGMIEFGYFFYVKNILAGAAREGARAGAPWNTTLANVNTAVTNAIAPTGLATVNPLYTVAVTDTSGNTISDLTTVPSGSQFRVTLSTTWGTVGAGFRPLALISTGKVMKTTCVMQKEY